MIERRAFITLLGGAAAYSLQAHAQQSAVPLIGYMDTASASTTAHFVEAFRRGLSAAGYDEGRNVAIEYRWSDGDYDKLPAFGGGSFIALKDAPGPCPGSGWQLLASQASAAVKARRESAARGAMRERAA